MYFHFSQKLDLAACQCCVCLASNLALNVLRDVGVQGCCCCWYVLSPSLALSKQLTLQRLFKIYTYSSDKLKRVLPSEVCQIVSKVCLRPC